MSGVHLAIPAYGGQVYGAFAASLLNLEQALRKRSIQFDIQWLWNESMVCRARNACAAQFIQNGTRSVLQFLDSDLEFSGELVAAQCQAVLTTPDLWLAGGSYPGKRYIPRGLSAAANAGLRGEALLAAGLRLVTNLDGEPDLAGGVAQDTPVEAWYLDGYCYVKSRFLPTGLMTIHRSVFEAIQKGPRAAELPYVTATGEPQWDFFQPIKQEIKGKVIRLSEDYAFCAKAKEVGIDCWWNVDNTAVHWGTHRYVPHGLHDEGL